MVVIVMFYRQCRRDRSSRMCRDEPVTVFGFPRSLQPRTLACLLFSLTHAVGFAFVLGFGFFQ